MNKTVYVYAGDDNEWFESPTPLTEAEMIKLGVKYVGQKQQ